MAEIPEEFLSALSGDTAAMQRFAGLPDREKEDVLHTIRRAQSAQEIDQIVSRL